MIPEACPVIPLIAPLALLLEVTSAEGSTGSVDLGFCRRLLYFIHTNIR